MCSINTEGVIERVKSLFVGNRELILGFNTFLPKARPQRLEHTLCSSQPLAATAEPDLLNLADCQGFEITLPEEPTPPPEPQVRSL